MHPLLKTIAKEIVVQNNSGSGKITIGSSNFVQVRNDKEIGKLFFYLETLSFHQGLNGKGNYIMSRKR